MVEDVIGLVGWKVNAVETCVCPGKREAQVRQCIHGTVCDN